MPKANRKETHADLSTVIDIQGGLCSVCGKRSHRWRSVRIEPGWLVEGKTDLAQPAIGTIFLIHKYTKSLQLSHADELSEPQWLSKCRNIQSLNLIPRPLCFTQKFE